MERKVYKITGSNGYVGEKYAWNSALREVEKTVRETASAEGTSYELIDSETTKDAFRNCVSGTRTWKSPGGKVVVFTVERIK